MSDQLRWFKVWTSLLVDMDNRPAADIGQWVRLGCRIALTGTNGTVIFADWDHAATFFGLSVDDAKELLDRLPSLRVEERPNRNGKLSVTMNNWHKYQRDSTGASRAAALRSKRRGDTTTGASTQPSASSKLSAVSKLMPTSSSSSSPRGDAQAELEGVDAGNGHRPQTSWATAPWGTPAALAHLYNEAAPDNVPAVETLSAQRVKKAKTMLRAFPAREWWVQVFAEYHASPFLLGQIRPGPGHQGFRPDFDWLLQTGKNGTENAVKVHDGGYRP